MALVAAVAFHVLGVSMAAQLMRQEVNDQGETHAQSPPFPLPQERPDALVEKAPAPLVGALVGSDRIAGWSVEPLRTVVRQDTGNICADPDPYKLISYYNKDRAACEAACANHVDCVQFVHGNPDTISHEPCLAHLNECFLYKSGCNGMGKHTCFITYFLGLPHSNQHTQPVSNPASNSDPEAEPVSAPASIPDPDADSQTLEAWKQDLLDYHNHYRCMHGVPSVAWNEKVAEGAASWLEKMIGLQHADSYNLPPPEGPAGENLAQAWPKINPETSVQRWYEEVNHCPGGPRGLSGCQAGTNRQPTGHFTALIWKGVKEIGCAVDENRLICRYWSGNSKSLDTANMGGGYAANVLPKVKSSQQCQASR